MSYLLPEPKDYAGSVYRYRYAGRTSKYDFLPALFDKEPPVPDRPTYVSYSKYFVKVLDYHKRNAYWSEVIGYALKCPHCSEHGCTLGGGTLFHSGEVNYYPLDKLPDLLRMKCDGCNKCFRLDMPFKELVGLLRTSPNGLDPGQM